MNTIATATKLSDAATLDAFASANPVGVKDTSQPLFKGIRALDNPKTQSEVSKESNETSSSMDEEEVLETAALLNDYMDDLQTNLGFTIRKDLNNQVIVEIKNRKTDELVKQIPTEEMVAIKEKMEELTGLIFDAKV